jgi:hypothetical protein
MAHPGASHRVTTQQHDRDHRLPQNARLRCGNMGRRFDGAPRAQYLSLLIHIVTTGSFRCSHSRFGCLQIDRYAAESVRPFDLHTEHVWMAAATGSNPAHLLNGSDHVIVDVTSGIP